MIDTARRDQFLGRAVIEVQRGEQMLRQANPVHRRLKTFADQKGLGGVLQNHGIACQQRRNDGVDGREIRVVPRRNHQHDPHRHALDHAVEAGPLGGHRRRQRLVGEFDQPAEAFLETAQLAAVAHRPAHLHRELGNDLVILRLQHRKKGQHLCLALGQRHPRPLLLRLPCAEQGFGNFTLRCDTPAGDFAAVDRRDADNIVHDDFTRFAASRRRGFR